MAWEYSEWVEDDAVLDLPSAPEYLTSFQWLPPQKWPARSLRPSRPWPYPASKMTGFVDRAATERHGDRSFPRLQGHFAEGKEPIV